MARTMAYTNFKSIPIEVVANDEAAWSVIRSTIKCPENMEVCDAMMKIAEDREVAGQPSYGVHAFRRAAILLAGTEFPVISSDWEFKYKHKINLPRNGVTTAEINRFIVTTLLEKRLATNPKKVFPASWWSDLNLSKSDPRIKDALFVIKYILSRSTKCDMSNVDITVFCKTIQHNQYKKDACRYFMYCSFNELRILKKFIEQLPK